MEEELNQKNILIVDDEPINIDLIKSYLRGQDYELFTAKDGQEALEEIHARDIDVILLDKMMPNINGIEFLNIIKREDKFKDIPVIMQTAAGDVQHMVEGYSAGAVFYLPKPFKQRILLEMLRKIFTEQDSNLEEAS